MDLNCKCYGIEFMAREEAKNGNFEKALSLLNSLNGSMPRIMCACERIKVDLAIRYRQSGQRIESLEELVARVIKHQEWRASYYGGSYVRQHGTYSYSGDFSQAIEILIMLKADLRPVYELLLKQLNYFSAEDHPTEQQESCRQAITKVRKQLSEMEEAPLTV